MKVINHSKSGDLEELKDLSRSLSDLLACIFQTNHTLSNLYPAITCLKVEHNIHRIQLFAKSCFIIAESLQQEDFVKMKKQFQSEIKILIGAVDACEEVMNQEIKNKTATKH